MAGRDVQVREGPGHPDPEIRVWAGGGEVEAVSKKVFLALRASVWYNNKAEARVPQAPPLDPPLIIIH